MKNYIVPWMAVVTASGLFGWGVASVTTWWGGIIAFFCMIPFLILVIAGGDMMGNKALRR